MPEIRVNPTRMELKKQKNGLTVARRGYKLLKDKRDELMKQFLETVRETRTLREKVEKRITAALGSFSVASAQASPNVLTESLMLPKKEGSLDVSYKNIMSVNVPVFDYKTEGDTSDYCNFGFAFTSGELDSSVAELSGIVDDMVKLAQYEKTSQMLASEIEKTRRRVNALEHIMIPRYEITIKDIRMKLDENERSNLTRLMKIKDMMVEEKIKKAKAEEENAQ